VSGSPDDDSIVVAISAARGDSGVGSVVEAGERAQALLGKRVLVGPIDPCGECDVCRRGGAAVCPLAVRRGALTAGASVRVAARWVVALGNGLELREDLAAAAAGELAIAYTLYARTGIGPKEPAIVVGTNAIARFLLQILLAKGISPTAVADPDDDGWIDWLLSKGIAFARIAASASDDDARATMTATLAAQDAAGRAWRVIACEDAARAAGLAGPRATLTVLAPVAGELSLPGSCLAREVAVIGVAGAHPDLVVEAAALCARGDVA